MTHEHVGSTTINRFGEEVQIDVFRFSWDEIGLEDVRKKKNTLVQTGATRKKLDKNTDKWGNWLVEILKERTVDPVRRIVDEGHAKYNATAVYMNEKNNEYLHEHIHAMDWLNWSPVTENGLADDEYGVELSKVVEENYGKDEKDQSAGTTA